MISEASLPSGPAMAARQQGGEETQTVTAAEQCSITGAVCEGAGHMAQTPASLQTAETPVEQRACETVNPSVSVRPGWRAKALGYTRRVINTVTLGYFSRRLGVDEERIHHPAIPDPGADGSISNSDQDGDIPDAPAPLDEEEIQLTCCERFKAFFQNCYTILSLLFQMICSCLYRWFCCCCKKDDDADLKEVQSQVTGISLGERVAEPASPAVARQSRYTRPETLIWGSNEREVKIYPNKEAWDAYERENKILENVVAHWICAFKYFVDGGTWGIVWNRNAVRESLEAVGNDLILVVENERYNREELLRDQNQAISDEVSKDIRNRIFSEILYLVFSKIEMPDARVIELYQLFHETRTSCERIEDKPDDPDGGCKLFLNIGAAKLKILKGIDMAYGACAYRMAIKRLLDERGLSLS
ncbi:hypothetical protein ElyMa_001796100 [Elysia marginata]|uniref:Uncharacterized protein n=1 Tax=Elysia marginata TaxID=1093978 RepID=A0AAV4EFD1_9GAST|nr:hypothetical protein ElyMa_001796100 [Elysia marginata]